LRSPEEVACIAIDTVSRKCGLTHQEATDKMCDWYYAWREHPDFEKVTAEHWARDLDDGYPHAWDAWVVAVYEHEPGWFKYTESYVVAPLQTAIAKIAWGERTLGTFKEIVSIPPMIRVRPDRWGMISYSFKGSGRKYAARMMLKEVIPRKMWPLISKVRRKARLPKWELLRKWHWYRLLDVSNMRNLPKNHMFRWFLDNKDWQPAWFKEQTKLEVVAQWELSEEEKKLILTKFNSVMDFINCAMGKVHPYEIKDYAIHQLTLF